MALTDKKRRYVAARLSGLSGAKAAIAAGYSEKGAAQAAARLNKDPDVAAALKRAGKVNNDVNRPDVAQTDSEQAGVAVGLEALGLTSDPKKVLVALMNDAGEDPKLRLEAAKALMPFVHARKGEGGKKEAKQEEAQKVASRFSAAAPPRLVASGGKKL
ncbi:MAG: terminase small subunit [Alcaligenaceae bacterium]|nr:terminase small subunit [Alcaligenaceae bacterium]